jgi:hypothetical protein
MRCLPEMKVIYTSLKLVEVHHLKNLLESAGIRCRLRNESLSTLAGEVPFTECAPQLLVETDSDFEAAQEVLRQWHRAAPSRHPAWTCQRCGEHIEGQFTACWRCGTERL